MTNSFPKPPFGSPDATTAGALATSMGIKGDQAEARGGFTPMVAIQDLGGTARLRIDQEVSWPVLLRILSLLEQES